MDGRLSRVAMVEFGQVNHGVLLVNIILVLVVVDADVKVSADWERVLLRIRQVRRFLMIHESRGAFVPRDVDPITISTDPTMSAAHGAGVIVPPITDLMSIATTMFMRKTRQKHVGY